MMKYLSMLSILFSILCSCQTEKNSSETDWRWVGDISYNEQIDDANFPVCNGDQKTLQYFNLGKGPIYLGEKSEILKIFNTQFKPIQGAKESGLIRIRFVVNCEGKADRFRILQSDINFEEKEFDPIIVTQLLDITKSIDQWAILYRADVAVDYYMYLIFKIKDGQLIEILP